MSDMLNFNRGINDMLMVLTLTMISFAGYSQRIVVGSEKNINPGDAFKQRVFAEPHLAINPKNSKHQVIGTYLINPESETDFYCAAIVTFDDWSTNRIYVFPSKETGDPWCEITEKGTVLFSYLNGLNVHRSLDGGITWQKDSVHLGEYHDHEVMVEDRSNGKYNGSIYLSSILGTDSMYIARSDNQGKSFDFRKKWKFSNLNTNTWTPVVLSDGTLVLPYSTFQRQGITKRVWLKSALAWLVTSIDGGKTFSAPSFICESCGKGFPVLVADASDSKFEDRLYFICSNHETKQIYLHYSPDKGNKWSEPVVIKQFTNRTETERPPFFGAPTASVNKHGIIGVIWQDRMEDSSGRCQYLYFSASIDGGETFLKAIKVSSAPSCPQDGNNKWAGDRWKAGGEYMGLVSKPDGSFQAVWADSRSGYFQLYTANIFISHEK